MRATFQVKSYRSVFSCWITFNIFKAFLSFLNDTLYVIVSPHVALKKSHGFRKVYARAQISGWLHQLIMPQHFSAGENEFPISWKTLRRPYVLMNGYFKIFMVIHQYVSSFPSDLNSHQTFDLFCRLVKVKVCLQHLLAVTHLPACRSCHSSSSALQGLLEYLSVFMLLNCDMSNVEQNGGNIKC